MKGGIFRKIMLGILAGTVLLTAGTGVQAMKALSSAEMGGVTAQQGISIFFKDLDASLLRMDEIELDLSPSDVNDCTFLITDDSNASTMPLSNDSNGYGMSFCGSPTDEAVPVDVDFLGFEIDIGSGDTGGGEPDGLNENAVTFSLKGYGSTALYQVWDLAQFVTPGGTAYDVFGLTLGEIFWAEKYIGPPKEEHLFMHILMSPLESYETGAFLDSNEGGWQLPAGTGLTKAQIRSNVGIGGELGLKPGGGTFGFTGFKKTSGSPQRATANSVMLAGKILDRGNTADPTPNWKTQNRTYYYQDDVDDWNIMGEAVIGVHHSRTYTRSGYVGKYINGNNYNMDTIASNQIGQASATRPLRIEMATANRDCNNDGHLDTYLVTYICGHYSRTVYSPDSNASSMGSSTDSADRLRTHIIGDLRIGFLEEKTADMDGDGSNESVTNGGSWVVNDISIPYGKIVIPGDRSLVQEISASSEDYLIPDRDYGNDGVNGVAAMNFADPTSTSRTMYRTNPTLGYPTGTWGNPPPNPADTALNPATTWN